MYRNGNKKQERKYHNDNITRWTYECVERRERFSRALSLCLYWIITLFFNSTNNNLSNSYFCHGVGPFSLCIVFSCVAIQKTGDHSVYALYWWKKKMLPSPSPSIRVLYFYTTSTKRNSVLVADVVFTPSLWCVCVSLKSDNQVLLYAVWKIIEDFIIIAQATRYVSVWWRCNRKLVIL